MRFPWATHLDEVCKQYLDQYGFIIQSFISEKMTLKIKKMSGFYMGINGDNVSQFFQFEAGVEWEIIDEYSVEITTPKYLGYQLGRLRKKDEGMALYRAMSVKDRKFFFESIVLFDDENEETKSLFPNVNSEMDEASTFND